MITRIDQIILLAKFLNNKKLLVRWDSFIRLNKNSFLSFFLPDTKRIIDEKLSNVAGNHYLPELIIRCLRFLKFKKVNVLGDLILAKLARYNAPKKFDILHGHGPYSLESGLLAKKMGKKFIYEISGQMFSTRKKQLNKIYQKYNIPVDFGIKYLETRRMNEAKIADAIICPSQIISKELCKIGFNKKKIFTYHHDSIFSDKLKDIKRNKYKQKKLILLFVGQISIAKGVQHAISVQKKLIQSGVNSELHILGFLVHKFLIANTKGFNIFFHGNRNFNYLKRFYKKANIFIFPSYTEGSSLAVIEAMVASLPIITSHNAGSFVKHGVNGFVCKPDDENKMLKYIYKLYKNPKIIDKMSSNSRKIYNQKMKKKYPQQIFDIYNKVLKRNVD